MTDKKRIKSWFMKNIILPNNEIIDQPGYIVYRFGSKKKNCYLREVLMPEGVLAGIETAFSKKYGNEGRKAVYSAGKLWGWRFAATSSLPRRGSVPDKSLLEVVEAIMRMLESEYSSKVEYRADLGKSMLEFRARDLLVCKLSGLGDFLTGTLNGTWEYMMGVQTEGAHLSCQGKRGKGCTILCAPPKFHGGNTFRVNVPAGLALEPEYFAMNRPRKPHYARNSLKDLLEGRAIEYEGGFFRYGKSRLILNESSSVYFLSRELSRLKGGERLLYETVKEGFRSFVPKKMPPEKFFTDILPALGWGDICLDKRNSRVLCFGYPWTSYPKRFTFPFMRGIAAGTLSSSGEDFDFARAEASSSASSLSLVLR